MDLFPYWLAVMMALITLKVVGGEQPTSEEK